MAGETVSVSASVSASTEHVYNSLLTAEDPFASQPKAIKIPLKPHQLAALQKAIVMEQKGVFLHKDTGETYPTRVSTNVGILGDQVGYGKTLTSLAIIAATKPDTFHRENRLLAARYSSGSSHYIEESLRDTDDSHHFINSTLVIVPHGPVFVQWEKALKTQTSLKYVAIDKITTIDKVLPQHRNGYTNATNETVRAVFDKYDVILIKNTMLTNLLDRHNVDIAHRWNRIMIDEAHLISSKIPRFSFKFMWLISGTYNDLFGMSIRTSTSRSITADIHETMYLGRDRTELRNLIRGDIEFVHASFNVPRPVEHVYICHMPVSMNIHNARPFLSREVVAMINANDFNGAIIAAGGKNGTETDMVKIVTMETERDLRNRQLELQLIQSLELPDELRVVRVKTCTEAIAKLESRLVAIRERVTSLSDKPCPICYDIMVNPTVLECTHSFCAQCIVNWLRHKNTCPECRVIIDKTKVISVVTTESTPPIVDAPVNTPVTEINRYAQYGYHDTRMEKCAMLLKLLTDKPDGKFLVFSQYDATFLNIERTLANNGISFGQMKGSTYQMMHTLNRFKNGEIRVILLNTYFAGSGIDISFATDVVIFHSMGSSKTQSVGRAQRVGRTEPLTVHNLLYFSETPAGISQEALARQQHINAVH